MPTTATLSPSAASAERLHNEFAQLLVLAAHRKLQIHAVVKRKLCHGQARDVTDKHTLHQQSPDTQTASKGKQESKKTSQRVQRQIHTTAKGNKIEGRGRESGHRTQCPPPPLAFCSPSPASLHDCHAPRGEGCDALHRRGLFQRRRTPPCRGTRGCDQRHLAETSSSPG